MPDDSSVGEFESDFLLDTYREMRKIREFEETVGRLGERGDIVGETHLYIGQEAVAAGVASVLRDDDFVGSTHRSHGHVLAVGSDVEAVMAEMGGKETGLNGGRGGEMHMFDPDVGLMETNALVGASTPHVAGAALSAKMDGSDRIGVAFFGDGGSNQGVVFETMNMAAIWDLPMIFLCENNQFAVTTAEDYSVGAESLADRAAGFGMPAEILDGQDVLAVHEAVSEAADRARSGDGPTFIECETYRFSGHFSAESKLLGEDQQYRSKEEVERIREERDPLDLLGNAMLEAGVADEADLAEIDDEIEAEVDDAVSAMMAAEYPPVEETYDHAYVNDSYDDFPAGKRPQ